MKRILLLCIVLLSGFYTPVLAQERTITGTVTSAADGTSIPGVSVVLKGTTTGTVTNVDGDYRLSVPGEGGILQFSFVGLVSQEVEIGARSVIDVVMSSDVRQLTEVVVTAQGVTREKKALGYSIENIEGEQVRQVSEPDPLRALQGKVAGVNIIATSGSPGSSTRITIRGNSSLLNNNQPLFVVDGIPYNNDFITSSGANTNTGGLTGGGPVSSRIADLDPNNIASITVLKGGAAAALYGSRAANGVILITTKTGAGRKSKKGLEIVVNSSYAIEKISNIPDYQNIYGTGTNFGYAQANGSWGAPFAGTRPYASVDSILHWYSGRPGMEEFNGVMVPYRAYPDNVKDFFETGSVLDNSITISGGNPESNFTAVLSQTQHNGFVPLSEYKRHAISVGGRSQLENGLFVGGNIQVTRSVQHGPISGVGDLGGSNPSAFARTLLLGRNWDLHNQPYQNPVDNGSEFMVGRGTANNPYWSVENTGVTGDVDRYVASINLGYDILDWLNVSYRVGINTYNMLQTEFQRPNGTGSPVGIYTEINARNTEINSDLLFTVNTNINEDFSLRFLFGHNVNQRTRDLQLVNGSEYVIFHIDDLDNMNSIGPGGGSYSRKRIIGLFGDISLGYRDYAFLTFTGRNDWSSTLPWGGKSFFYPAATASVILSDILEIESGLVDLIKLRGGWSQVGNDTDPYLLSNVFLINNSEGDLTSSSTSQKPVNGVAMATLGDVATDPNLKPETTTEIEVGVDLGLLQNRVIINATYYKQNSTDQIAQVSLPDGSGFASLLTNFGEVQNEGLELGVDLTPVRLNNGFTWNIYAAFTHNKNTIVELREGVEEITYGSGFAGSVSPVHRPGLEYGMLLGSVSARDDEGNLLIDPSNGQHIPAIEPEIIGNPNPDFLLGITNTFSYKGISLRAVFDWKEGGDLFSDQVGSMLGRGVLEHQGDRETMVLIPGVYGDPNTLEPIRNDNGEKIPNQTMIEVNDLYFGQTYASNGADEWQVWDATTYRLREVSLSYSLPQSLIENTPFGAVEVGLMGRNLWYWAPHFPEDSNYDPETNQFGARNIQGIEYTSTPSAKRYAVNLRVSF